MSVPQLPQEMVNKILYDFKGFQPYPFLKEFKDIINIMKYPDDYIWDEGVERKTMGWPHGLWINRYLDDEGIYIDFLVSFWLVEVKNKKLNFEIE